MIAYNYCRIKWPMLMVLLLPHVIGVDTDGCEMTLIPAQYFFHRQSLEASYRSAYPDTAALFRMLG